MNTTPVLPTLVALYTSATPVKNNPTPIADFLIDKFTAIITVCTYMKFQGIGRGADWRYPIAYRELKEKL